MFQSCLILTLRSELREGEWRRSHSGEGGGAGRAPNYPFSLLNAEAGKFAGCVSCRRENVLSVNSRQSPGLLLDYSCFDAFFASKSSRFVLLLLFTSLPSNSERSLLACSPNNKASLLQEKSEYYVENSVRMRGMECPAVGTQLSVVEVFSGRTPSDSLAVAFPKAASDRLPSLNFEG